ncbi:MAG: phage tail tape measure protein [Lachnospiraceae bacterium]|nr:phage tail tape measure protein [Lachnospiraceae bacterium]
MALQSIGVRIGLEGGKEFTDALRGAAQEVKTYVAELKKAEGLKDPFSKASGSMTALHNAIKNQEEVVRGWREQLDLAINKFGAFSPEASKFKEELVKAETKLQSFRSELEKLSTTSVEIKGLGTFKRDLETMSTAVSTFRSEFKNFENLSGLSNVFTKSSGMKSSLTSEIKTQEEVVKLLAEDYEKAARESGAFSTQALELRGKLADATVELRNMQQELKDLPNAFMLAGDEAKKLADKVTGIGQSLSGIGSSTRVLSGGAAGILGGIIKEYSEFEKQMSQVAKVQELNVKASEEDAAAYKKLEERARELGRTTVFSAVEAAEALEILGRAGLSVEEAVALSGPALDLAAAEEVELAEAASVLVDTLNSLGYEKNYDNARRLADVLAQTSRNSNTNLTLLSESLKYAGSQAGALGWSMEDLAFMLGLAADFGVKSTQAGTGLRQGLKNLISPTDKTALAMEKFGISLDDGKGGIIDNITFLKQLRSAFGDLDVNVLETNGELRDGEEVMEEYGDSLPVTKMEKLQAICDIFGTRAMPTMLALIRTAPDDFDDLTTAISQADNAAKEMADTAIDNLSGEWTLLIDQVKDLALEFGQTLVPVLREGLQVFREILQGFSGLDEGTKKTILKVLALTAAVSPFFTILGGITKGIGGLISMGGSLIGGVGKVIRLFTGAGGLVPAMASVAQGATGAGGLASSLSGVGTTVGAGSTGLVGKLGGLAKAAGPFLLKGAIVVGIAAGAVWLGKKIYEHWDDIKRFLGETWEAIKTMASDIWEGITTVISGVWEGVKKVAEDVWGGVTTFLSETWGGIKRAAEDIWGGITTFVTDCWEGIKTVSGTVWNGLTTFLSTTWEGLKTVAGGVWGGITTIVSDCWNGIEIVSNTVWNGLTTFLSTTWEGIKIVARGAFDGIAKVISDTWSGIEYVAGVSWNGITTLLSGLWGGIKTIAVGAFDGIATVVSDTWNGIEYVAGVSWNGITTLLGGLWEGIKTVGVGIFEGFAGALGDIWEGIKTVAERAWEGISGIIGNVWEGVKGLAENIAGEFVGIGNSLETAIQNVKTKAGNAWAESIMSNEDTAKSASEMMKNFENGVKNGKKGPIGAIKGFAKNINELLHHSTPDKGPLKDDDTWMPDMMKQFAHGIRDYIPEIQKASRQAAAAMVPSHYAYLPEPGNVNSSTVSMGGVNFTINTQPGQDPEAIAYVVERRLTNMIARQQYAYS